MPSEMCSLAPMANGGLYQTGVDMTTPNAIVEWLEALPHVSAVTPLTVQIGTMCYPAARYTSMTPLDPSCRAYQEGKRESVQTMIYCAGKLPACYVRARRVAFRLPQDARDWYIASYAPAVVDHKQADAIDSAFSDFHPFSASFQLAPWDLPETLDKFEPTPYRRVEIQIKEWAR